MAGEAPPNPLSAMSGMLFMMPLMYLMNKIDFKEGDNELYLRVGFVAAQLLTGLFYLFIYTKIQAKGVSSSFPFDN